MQRYIKVEGQDGFVRDVTTGAILSTASKTTRKSFSNEFKNVVSELNTLKEEMSEIKSLLKQLIK
jgi:predicted transcriptional regulator